MLILNDSYNFCTSTYLDSNRRPNLVASNKEYALSLIKCLRLIQN